MVTRTKWSPTREEVLDIRQRIANGEKQHDIAAVYGTNQGRISEINTGQRFAHVNDNEPQLF
jgi:hypothetical protein